MILKKTFFPLAILDWIFGLKCDHQTCGQIISKLFFFFRKWYKEFPLNHKFVSYREVTSIRSPNLWLVFFWMCFDSITIWGILQIKILCKHITWECMLSNLYNSLQLRLISCHVCTFFCYLTYYGTIYADS